MKIIEWKSDALRAKLGLPPNSPKLNPWIVKERQSHIYIPVHGKCKECGHDLLGRIKNEVR